LPTDVILFENAEIIELTMVKLVILVIAIAFIPLALFFATRNGFYNTDRYHGNGSAH
jgi:hypothetical protein